LSSSLRGFVLMASGLGGFWCARILLINTSARAAYTILCIGILTAILVLVFLGYWNTGDVNEFIYTNPHPVVHFLLLLTFAPLSLLALRKPLITVFISVPLLVCVYLALYLCGSRIDSGVLISLVLLFVAVILAPIRSYRILTLMIVLLLIGSCITSHYIAHVSKKSFSASTYQASRVEQYPFSGHIAKQHPLFGIGLRSPRVEYLQNYEIWYPNTKSDTFVYDVTVGVTSENVFLTFMSDLGLPFFALYSFALLILLFRLFRALIRPVSETFFHPLALLLPITGSLLHSLNTDTLLYPQLSWYFHILLGLIPVVAPAEVPRPKGSSYSSWFRLAGALAVVLVGCLVGTHQALAPEKIHEPDTIHSYLRQIPFISIFQTREKIATKPHQSKVSGPDVTVTKEDRRVLPADKEAGTSEALLPGTLTINVKNYKGIRPKWALLVILDNSETMAVDAENWQPNRVAAAADFIGRVETEMPRGSQIAIRYFSDEVFVKKKGRTLPLGVSHLLDGWADVPVPGLTRSLRQIASSSENNPCNAVVRALRQDFGASGGRVPRIAILTDGRAECSIVEMSQELKRVKMKESVKIDVVALGIKASRQDSYLKLAESTGGTFLKIDGASDLDSSVTGYALALNTRRQEPFEVVGNGTTYTIPPGQKLDLPPGQYTIRLSSVDELDSSRKLIRDVKINSGETRVVEVSVDE
jgi:O-Antigen ligase